MLARLTKEGQIIFGPSMVAVALYCEIAPQITTRAFLRKKIRRHLKYHPQRYQNKHQCLSDSFA